MKLRINIDNSYIHVLLPSSFIIPNSDAQKPQGYFVERK